MNKKILVIIILLVFFLIIGFSINKEYNKPENIKKRAIKYCIDNKYEFRNVVDSDGKNNDYCIVDGVKNSVLEFYLRNN